ncbi:hypothetical protein D3C86_1974860 [compost metagenome]
MHVLDVATGTESAAIAGKHHYPYRHVTAQFSAEIDKLLDLLARRQGIARVGMVHAHGDDAALTLNL